MAAIGNNPLALLNCLVRGPQMEEEGAGPHLFLSKKSVILHQMVSYSATHGVFMGVMHNHRLSEG